LRGLLAYQWAFPGKKLLFMGGELGQRAEWDEERGLDWPEADPGLSLLVADANARYREISALWIRDADPHATHWLASDAPANLLAFARYGGYDEGTALVCVANFSGVQARDHRIGMPWPGPWREVLNTDATVYGGSGTGNLGTVVAMPEPWSGQPASARVTVGARTVVWLAGRYAGAASA
jgi:1,4-alpha-glucan branching enzyme